VGASGTVLVTESLVDGGVCRVILMVLNLQKGSGQPVSLLTPGPLHQHHMPFMFAV
jgi:hypothetical protein